MSMEVPSPEKQPDIDFFSPDFYKRLGVSRSANEVQLKAAYRKAVKSAFFLDMEDGSEITGASTRRKLVNEAYICLNNSKARMKYDYRATQDSSWTSPDETHYSTPEETEAEEKLTKKQAIEKIKNNLHLGIQFFLKTRAYLVKQGIIKEEEINNLKEVRDYALSDMTVSSIGLRNTYAWMAAGVISRAEAEEILKGVPDEEERIQQKNQPGRWATAINIENTEINYETRPQLKILNMEEFVGKPKSEVVNYVIKTYGGQYHLPGSKYQKYLLENQDKVPAELKNSGNFYYLVGSTVREGNDSLLIFSVYWTSSGLRSNMGDIGKYGTTWNKDSRIILLELPSKELETDIQSSFHVEEMPFWGEFHGGEIDEVGEYKEPTQEQREKFQKRNERMSEIFEGADFQWYLDGAVNISLYGNHQIRDHKDLDISVFKEDLGKLEELLSKQGFGIFVHYEEGEKRLMKRITIKELSTLDKPDLSICKVSPDGKIQKEDSEPFNFVDLHVHSKDTEGNTLINYSGATLPKGFFEPVKKELPNGKKINLSQPAIVAYHKLHSERPYDLTDLQRLRPYLQEKDFVMLREVLGREIEETEKRVKEKLQEVWNLLSPILEITHDTKFISEQLWAHPDIEKRKSDPRTSEYVSLISQYVSENLGISFDDFLTQSLSILKLREHLDQKLKFIEQLEKS